MKDVNPASPINSERRRLINTLDIDKKASFDVVNMYNNSEKDDVDNMESVMGGGDDNHNNGSERDMLIPAGSTDELSTKKRLKKVIPLKNSTLESDGVLDEHQQQQQQQQHQQLQQQQGSIFTTDMISSSSSLPATKLRAARKQQRKERAVEKMIKYVALLLLVGQMVGLVLLMRYSRTVPRPPEVPLYLASTAVFIMEFMKLVICLAVVVVQSGSKFGTDMKIHIFQSPMEILKLCIPSLLYTVQNNLLYLALTNLDAATYQVCYQLKILTTALFSAALLGRTFSATKWASLVVLTAGVAVVEISGSGDQHNSTSSGDDQELQKKNRFIGIVAVVCAACTSGFSGVYFEKILKGSNTSLWIRNIQMGLPSIIIAYVTIYFKDAATVQTQGFFGGYTPIVWTVVVIQAVGGLIVATVVKYADNVLKVFATSFSIVISCIISAFLFDFHPSFLFIVGASLVVIATVMYSSPEKKERRKSLLPLNTKPRK